ncbi:MAG: xanthine dehydrogenase family protein molybdopterin-binding subunit [Gemmataceae bacterium]|nr:xanthine dehydrogenase family protein molybdopterin-binding subunit [Gemmataceae bacterium]MCI0742125.1 xanthine dehydrogenase family protein molybdopterin-binding subunit [Gemmataceae bacterium]
MAQVFQVIGTRPIRHDGLDKVTGRAQYGADIQLSGMLHGRVLRSSHAHARIKSIDASAALKVPGVEAVATAADLPESGDRIAHLGEGAVNLRHLSSNCLARGKVHYKGQAVAALAATNPHIAEEALALIKVDYEPLPPVMDVREAMKDSAPKLHADVFTEEMGQLKKDKPSNVAKHFQFKLGDVHKGFAQAAVTVEREFHTATVHQGYIEPHNATAMFNPDGNVTIWCSTQGAFTVRAQVSELLQIPVSRIKVVPLEIGGGFGGKIRVYLEPVAAVLSKKTGKPVKILMDRAAVFEGTGPTPGSYIRVKLGADKTGKLVAGEAYLAYEAGAFPGSPIGPGAMCIFACYDIPNVLIDGFDVCVNKPATAAYRAPGATNAAFASETVVDEICRQLKIDPLEFRLKNGAKEGTRRADGPIYPRIGMIETVEAAKKHPHYVAPLAPGSSPFPRGRGVASGFWFNIGLKSSVTASVNNDGTVSLVEGSTDIGGTRVSVAMQLAEALGIRAEDVRPVVADTDSVGYTDVTGGSRVTYATGWAAYEAAQDIKWQMLEKAAQLWKTDLDNVVYDKGVIRAKDDPAKKITFKELAEKIQHKGGIVVGRATVDPPWPGGAFATHIVDVEVDPDTGKVSILRYTAVQDCGKAIHPSYVEGQIQGGAVQGIGWALNEEYAYNAKGEMTNASFLDYRMPTSLDLPMIDAVIVEVPDPKHPYGVRGVGEVPIVPPPAAIANAIYAAVGVRMNELPMSPGRVVKALAAKK